MNSVLLAAGCAVAYMAAYRLYGRFLARRIFSIRSETPTPAHSRQDGIDYVPTGKEILFETFAAARLHQRARAVRGHGRFDVGADCLAPRDCGSRPES